MKCFAGKLESQIFQHLPVKLLLYIIPACCVYCRVEEVDQLLKTTKLFIYCVFEDESRQSFQFYIHCSHGIESWEMM